MDQISIHFERVVTRVLVIANLERIANFLIRVITAPTRFGLGSRIVAALDDDDANSFGEMNSVVRQAFQWLRKVDIITLRGYRRQPKRQLAFDEAMTGWSSLAKVNNDVIQRITGMLENVIPPKSKFFIKYTISEDGSGTQDERIARMLAPLAQMSECSFASRISEPQNCLTADTSHDLVRLAEKPKVFDPRVFGR
jgi:hypothetical protein